MEKGPGQQSKYNGFAEITKDTNPANRALFKQLVIDAKNEEELSKYITEGGREGVHVLLDRLSPEFLILLFEKTPLATLKKVFSEMNNIERSGLDKKMATIEGGTERLTDLRLKVEEPELGVTEEDLNIKTEKENIETIEMPIVTLEEGQSISGEESIPIIRELKKALELIEEIKEEGYIVHPSALERKSYQDCTVEKLEEIVGDLKKLKGIIKDVKSGKLNFDNTQVAGGEYPILSDTVENGDYSLTPVWDYPENRKEFPLEQYSKTQQEKLEDLEDAFREIQQNGSGEKQEEKDPVKDELKGKQRFKVAFFFGRHLASKQQNKK